MGTQEEMRPAGGPMRPRTAIVGILLFVASSALARADVVLFTFRGTVTDSIGRPLGSTTVSDGFQSTQTAPDGTYELAENSNGSYSLTAQRGDTLTQTKSSTVVVPDNKTVDFELRFRLGITISRQSLSTRDEEVSALATIHSSAPAPGSPEQPGRSCVKIADSRTGTTTDADLDSVLPDGSSLWSHVLTLPHLTPEGPYRLAVRAEDCASGVHLTGIPEMTYVVDNTSPTVERKSGDWQRSDALVEAIVRDTGGSGLAHLDALVFVDGERAKSVVYQSASGLLRAEVPGLDEGSHEASIDAVDHSGNHTTLSWTFSVDIHAPAWSGASPTGDITTRSPLLTVTVDDLASGIVPESITMELGYGLLTGRVQHSYDEASGRITYQVPDTVTGIGLGQLPLLDGHYAVRVTARDVAGNALHITWSFRVETLPI